MTKLIPTIIFIVIVLETSGQCNVQTLNRPDGVVVKSMPAELIGKTSKQEVALSIQTNGEFFYLATIQLNFLILRYYNCYPPL